MSTTALVLALIAGDHVAGDVLLVALACAAGLESIFALCLGCKIFALLIRSGAVPESVCAECANVSLR